jgi:hypothetical protein
MTDDFEKSNRRERIMTIVINFTILLVAVSIVAIIISLI